MTVGFFAGGQKESSVPLRVAVPYSVSSIPVLELDGHFLDGRTVRVSLFHDHSLIMAEFLRGDVDVLMTGFTQGINVFAGNKDVRHLATLVWGVSSIMVRDSSLSSVDDLCGKKLAVPFAGSPLDLQTRSILSSRNLLDKVLIEYAPPQQAVALVLAGKVDAAAVPEPLPSRLEETGKIFRLARYQDLWSEVTGGEARSPQVSLFVRKTFVVGHQRLITHLLKEVENTIVEVTADPESAAARHSATFQLSQQVVKNGLANTFFGMVSNREARILITDYMERIGLEDISPLFFYEN
jgi:NitT/TauT family transport system substrate-binding protein